MNISFPSFALHLPFLDHISIFSIFSHQLKFLLNVLMKMKFFLYFYKTKRTLFFFSVNYILMYPLFSASFSSCLFQKTLFLSFLHLIVNFLIPLSLWKGIFLSFILSLFSFFLPLSFVSSGETSSSLPASPWENEHFVLRSFFSLSANHLFPFPSLSLRKDESLSSSLVPSISLLFPLSLPANHSFPFPPFLSLWRDKFSLCLSLSLSLCSGSGNEDRLTLRSDPS